MEPESKTRQIIRDLQNRPYVIIPSNELQRFLDEVEILDETDTCMSDFLRIVAYDGHVLVQELSPKDEVIIRPMNSIESARKFIAGRMDIYEKMWDGCGCRVNYYE